MIRRLIILLLIVGCEEATAPEPEDCAGVAGGTAVVDDCGICNGIADYVAGSCYDCADTPNGTAVEDDCGVCGGDALSCDQLALFVYNSSMMQAFYYFTIVKIDDKNISSSDWVGAFNNDVCVGARQWDTSLCGSGICELPVMGSDGNSGTDGYMQSGGIPTFKIFDASENTYYDAVASENLPWVNNGFNIIESLNAITNSAPN